MCLHMYNQLIFYYINRKLAKKMKDSGEEPNDESSNSQRGSKRHNRHSMEQIQILEKNHHEPVLRDFRNPGLKRVFENCPLLNENQQNQLAREAKLEPKQVTMWFQNKRTQIKT
uniref:Homeobox domain-containing protein n=1 Tax=Solanum lycopersicum TaxID=4081 RepID=A0A3Q7I6A9_SOLLC